MTYQINFLHFVNQSHHIRSSIILTSTRQMTLKKFIVFVFFLSFSLSLSHRPNSIPTEKPVKKVRLSEETVRAKDYEDTFDRYDLQQQIRASIVSLPGELQLPPSIQISRKRSWLLSKILLSSSSTNLPFEHLLLLLLVPFLIGKNRMTRLFILRNYSKSIDMPIELISFSWLSARLQVGENLLSIIELILFSCSSIGSRW